MKDKEIERYSTEKKILVLLKMQIDLNSKLKKGWNSVQIDLEEYDLSSGLYFLDNPR